MNAESKQTLRHVAGVAALRALEILGGVFLVTVVPKLMGADVYGQFSLLLSVSLWFSLLSGMGNASVLTRYAPEFTEREDHDGLARLVGRLMVLRFWGGVSAGLGFTALMVWWLPDIDGQAVGIVALSVVLRSAANLPYAVLLGINQAALWAVAEVLRRGMLAPIAVVGHAAAGLRGVCWAMLALEVVVLGIGVWWTRRYLRWQDLKWDRAFVEPYAKFSIGFVVGNLMLALTSRIGGPLVKALEGSYADVAQFSVAYGMYLAGAFGLVAVYQAVGAKLSAMQIRGDAAGLRRWVNWLLTGSGALSVSAAAMVYWVAGDWLEQSLGPQYRGVGQQVEVLCLAGVLTAPGMLARVLTVSLGKGDLNAKGSTLQLVTFVAASAGLFPWLGVVGVAWGVVAGTAALSLYMSWGLRETGAFAVKGWGQVVGAALAAAMLVSYTKQ